MGSFASLEEIAAAALRRREAQHARLSAQHEQEPELDSPSPAPPERASSFWGLAALGEGLEALPARLGEGLGGLERRVGSGLEGFPERAVERLEGLLHHESPLLAATIGKSPSLYSLRAGLSPSGSLTPHPADHYGGGSRAAGGRVRLASKSQRSSPQRSHRAAGVRLRRSLSLPTSSGMRRVARRAKGTAEQLQTKALQVAHAQEQLLYFFYSTRDALAEAPRAQIGGRRLSSQIIDHNAPSSSLVVSSDSSLSEDSSSDPLPELPPGDGNGASSPPAPPSASP